MGGFTALSFSNSMCYNSWLKITKQNETGQIKLKNDWIRQKKYNLQGTANTKKVPYN